MKNIKSTIGCTLIVIALVWMIKLQTQTYYTVIKAEKTIVNGDECYKILTKEVGYITISAFDESMPKYGDSIRCGSTIN